MPDTREISALTTAESTSASDLFETALPNAMTETGYISRKVTLGTIANFLLSTLQFSSLNTTVKNIIGAINELARGSGQSLDTLNDVDIDDQTLTDGQGIVYDATAQKWKNGAVSGGGHTYSTTEQVVGTWIDGRNVYEKTFEFDNPSAGNAILAHGITNFDSVISVVGSFHRGDGYDEPVPFPHNDVSFMVSLVDFTSTQMTRVVGSVYTDTYELTRASFTVRYLKTT